MPRGPHPPTRRLTGDRAAGPRRRRWIICRVAGRSLGRSARGRGDRGHVGRVAGGGVSTAAPLPQQPRARGAGTVRRVLPQPFTRRLQIRQPFAQSRSRLRERKRIEVLSLMFAQFWDLHHRQPSQRCPHRASQSDPAGLRRLVDLRPPGRFPETEIQYEAPSNGLSNLTPNERKSAIFRVTTIK